MNNDDVEMMIRGANPVTDGPSRDLDDAWDALVTWRHDRTETIDSRRHVVARGRTRRVLVGAAVVLLVAASTVVGVNVSNNSHSLSSRIATAFGVVNPDAAAASGFTTTPSSPPGVSDMTCPTSQVCYLATENFADAQGSTLVTNAYKTVDGGVTWTTLSLPTTSNADTSFTCISDTVCSLGVVSSSVATSNHGFAEGTVQSMLTTSDGGVTWTSRAVTINPVEGVDSALDPSLVNVQGQWTQLQCFSETSCLAVASVPSDQPAQPFTSVGPDSVGANGVVRAVVMRTDDGGITWTSHVLPWSNAIDGSPGWSNDQLMTLTCATSSDCVGLSTVFHSVVNNAQTANVLVWRSTDGGNTWQTNWAPVPAMMNNGGQPSLTCVTPLQCFAIVQTGTSIPPLPGSEIMTTRDGGLTWTFTSPSDLSHTTGTPMYRNISCTSATTCWVAGGAYPPGHLDLVRAVIWATSDAGQTWSTVPLPTGLGIARQVVCVEVASCLAVALPSFSTAMIGTNGVVNGAMPEEIVSNQGG